MDKDSGAELQTSLEAVRVLHKREKPVSDHRIQYLKKYGVQPKCQHSKHWEVIKNDHIHDIYWHLYDPTIFLSYLAADVIQTLC